MRTYDVESDGGDDFIDAIKFDEKKSRSFWREIEKKRELNELREYLGGDFDYEIFD